MEAHEPIGKGIYEGNEVQKGETALGVFDVTLYP
jgi:hypothetical protein